MTAANAMKESIRRSIIKTLSYRAIVTAILALILFIYDKSFNEISTISIIFAILATVAYYFMKGFGQRYSGLDTICRMTRKRLKNALPLYAYIFIRKINRCSA